jgi:hypothetical protein
LHAVALLFFIHATVHIMSNEIPPIPPSILEAAAHIPEEELETMRERSEGDVYYAAIGRIATEWATFEHSIQIEIWKLIQPDYQISACLTSQIGQSGRLMDCLIALLSLRGAEEDHLKSIRSFASKIGDYQRRRNRMVHDPLFLEFSHDKIKALRMEISASKKPVYEPIHETIDDLYKFILKIDALTDELSALVGAKPVKPWPEKLPLPSALQPPDRSL